MKKLTAREVGALKTLAVCAGVYYATTFVINHLPVNKTSK